MEPQVEAITADRARPVRHEVLRGGRPWDEVVYTFDDDPRTLHLGAFIQGELVSVASVLPEPPPGEPRDDAWRLRGMATIDGHRGRGIGAALLDRCLAHARSHGAGLVWCNARVGAVSFYRRRGFVTVGEEFEIPGAGRHVVMRTTLVREP